MWFFSKQPKPGQRAKGAMQFLRKGLPERREKRTVPNTAGQRLLVGTALLWLLLSGTLAYVGLFSTYLVIGTPRIAGLYEISEDTFRGSVEREIEGKYLGLFPRRDFLLVRPRALEERLRREYPLLASVRVTRAFPDGLHIEVVERKKILIWCSGDVTGAAPGAFPPDRPCYLIDEAGIAEESGQALLSEYAPYVLFITDTSGKPVVIGDRVFDPHYGAFVIRMSELFPQQLGIAIEPRFTTVSRFANELRVRTDEGWEAYFGTDIPIESSLAALTLLFEKELPQEKRTRIAYIDVRAENRLYYAFREGENAAGPSDVSSPVPTEEKKAEAASKKKKK